MSKRSPATRNRIRAFYEQHTVLILAVLALALTLALYADALTYTAFNDDPPYLRATQDETLISIFTTQTSIQYYRPLNFLPIELLDMLYPIAPAVPLHVLGVLVYAADALLAALVTRRLLPDRPLAPALALLLVATLPFSYQAVPWITSMGHTLAALGVMLAVLGLIRWWEQRRWQDWALIAGGALIAAFSHENGVIVTPLLALWLWLLPAQGSLRKLWEERRAALMSLAPAAAINLLYVLAWQSLSNNPDRPAISLLEDVPSNLLYYLQALGYPVSQFGGRLAAASGLGERPAALIMGVAGSGVLGAGLWIAYRSKERLGRVALFGLGWYGLSGLLPSLFLDGVYVSTSPRLLVMAGPALALMWGLAVDAGWRSQQVIVRGAAALTAVLAVVGGAWFVRARLNMQTEVDRLYKAIYAEVKEHGNDLVLFNVPAWVAPEQSTFAYGTEGVVYKPDYLAFHILVWANTGLQYNQPPAYWPDIAPVREGVLTVTVQEAVPTPDQRTHMVEDAQAVASIRALTSGFALETAVANPPLPADDALKLANGVKLLPAAHFDARREAVAVALTVETSEGPVADTLFVHLLCGEELIAQADGTFLRGIYPFDRWSEGERWQETRLIDVPQGTDPDCLAVRVGMFNPATGERVPLQDGSEWVIIPVESAP